jgi:hypothetical protein
MNAGFLANAAERAAQKFSGILSTDLQRQVARGHSAAGLGQQDESISDAAVRATAIKAIKAIDKINERFQNSG